jgi:hypothetical protein
MFLLYVKLFPFRDFCEDQTKLILEFLLNIEETQKNSGNRKKQQTVRKQKNTEINATIESFEDINSIIRE